MKGFLGSAVVRAILWFLGLILVSLAIWFIGPLLAFGDMHPLADVGLRVTAIGLLLVLVIFVLLEWTLSVIGVASLCLLVWHAGPLLALGGLRPLQTVGMRTLVIGVILLCYAIWGIYTLWNLIRSDEKFAERLFKKDPNATKDLARDEVRALGETTRKAVGQLKQMRHTMAGGTGSLVAGLRRLVEGKRYLYELPWYMVIGMPGAGKTSVLLNSGLKFPVAEQMGAASAQLTLAKHEGTLNCAWWFTNEAVLIDTAGRYTNPSDGTALHRAAASTESAAKAGAVAGGGDGAASGDAKPSAAVGQVAQQELLNAAEWQGFLRVLRQVRTRAPINGALLAVDVSKLLSDDEQQNLVHAAQLRARLSELRQHLGIRFPVYVMLTKTDLLQGFAEYFSSLTTEARAQVWGFTLPWHDGPSAPADAGTLAQQLGSELAALQHRIAAGVATRLQEEFEQDRRHKLYVLPHELEALAPRLVALLDAVFSDSRYDTTQLTHSLRGVYLTSAMQYDNVVVNADDFALVPRLARGLAALLTGSKTASAPSGTAVPMPEQTSSTRSYFMGDAMGRVVIPEAHLVKPNLRWEARFRLLRLLGHALVIGLFFWFSAGLMLSYTNNQGYLKDVGSKTEQLTGELKQLMVKQDVPLMVQALGLAQALPTHSGLDLGDPSSAYRYGLYSAPPVADAAHQAYANLQDRLILPVLTQRMEAVMRQAVKSQDPKAAYDALHVYLLLHDAKHFANTPTSAEEVRAWVMKDWQDGAAKEGVSKAGASATAAGGPSLAASFANSSVMGSHLQAMFSGKRVVQSATGRDEALVRAVRDYLGTSPSSERLYERAKAALSPDAPQDFTLVRALGPQAGTLFSRASGRTLEQGVNGLFTYDGYHDLFAKRLPEMVSLARLDDAWVMGRLDDAVDKPASAADAAVLVDDVRRQYLNEYARKWSEFLDDIRTVKTEGGGSLAFDLNVLRQFAAPDSPLVRLGRMAARETTLSRPLQTRSEEEKSLFEKATEKVDQQSAKVSKGLGLRPEQVAERQYVDERFGALREVVTGQSDGAATPGGKPALDGIVNLLNEYYTVLVVADTAISSGSLPPAGVDTSTKIKIEAGKLPAPFREVLLGMGASGTDKVTQGAASILRVQAQAQMDRLVGMQALLVGEPCRRNIAGRYPFAQSSQEVAIEDFNGLFGAGGPADEYFNKYLVPLVDTSSRPWHYKDPATASALVGTEAMASGQAPAAAANGPTLTGELLKLLVKSGPNPEAYAQMAQIREAFFREPGAKRMAWKLDLSVQSLDSTITELLLDMDGQAQRYAHGPVQALAVQWPGPRGGTMAEFTAQPRIKTDTSTIAARGPWALMRLMERGKITTSANAGKVAVEFQFDNRRAVIEVSSSGTNPLASNLLKNFSCPGRIG